MNVLKLYANSNNQICKMSPPNVTKHRNGFFFSRLSQYRLALLQVCRVPVFFWWQIEWENYKIYSFRKKWKSEWEILNSFKYGMFIDDICSIYCLQNTMGNCIEWTDNLAYWAIWYPDELWNDHSIIKLNKRSDSHTIFERI